MPDPIPSQPRRRRWLRRLAIAVVFLVALLAVSYSVLTSRAFFKGVILPKAGQALHARVTVADAVIRPFSMVTLRDLKVETTGTEPLLTAREVRAQYSLWDILRGRLNIAEVLVAQPTVTLVNNADGTSNLDPLTQAEAGPPKKAERGPSTPKGKPSQPPRIDLGKFALENATVRTVTHLKGGGETVAAVSNVTITLDNLKNGQTGKLSVGADLVYHSQPSAPQPGAALQATLASTFEVALGEDLSLSAFRGNLQLRVPQATGSLSEISGFALGLETDLSANPEQQNALLRSFKLNGSRRDTTLLLATLTSPFHITWGGRGGADASDAAMTLTLTNLNLADWRGFVPDLEPLGQAHATLQVTSQKSGQRLGMDLAAAVEGLGAKLGSNVLTGLQVALAARGEIREMKQAQLASYQISLLSQGEPAVKLDGAATVDLEKNTAQIDTRLEAQLQRLLQIFPQPTLTLSAGVAQLDTRVSQQYGAIDLSGKLAVHSMTGNLDGHPVTDLRASANYDLGWKQTQQLDLRRFQWNLAPTTRATTNAFDLTGTLDLSKPDALDGTLRLTAETLDLTPYYDLFADSPPSGNKTASPPPSSSLSSPGQAASSPGPETEPAPVHLPIKTLTFNAAIRRCYLRELDVANLIATARLTGDQVTLKPLQLSLNGAAVAADFDVNLKMPGYRYAVNLNATRVPLEPIANSFSPDYRAQAKGEVLVALNLQGEGVTGPSLQKNLAGAMNLSLTNADIQLVGPRAKALLTPIAVVLGSPELLKSPLKWLGTEAKVGAGKLELRQFSVVSPAFTAGAAGEIPLAARLQDSPIHNWPVNFALRRGLAERLNLVPKGDTEGDYVLLPNMVKAAGTLGAPETKVDKSGLLQVGARVATALPGHVGKEASKLVGQADDLLGGRLTGTSKTNAASTNPAPATKLRDLFRPKSK